MGSLGIMHWIIVLAVAAIFVVPFARILKRIGFSPWLALLSAVPLVNIGFLWALAYMKWPRDDVSKEF